VLLRRSDSEVERDSTVGFFSGICQNRGKQGISRTRRAAPATTGAAAALCSPRPVLFPCSACADSEEDAQRVAGRAWRRCAWCPEHCADQKLPDVGQREPLASGLCPNRWPWTVKYAACECLEGFSSFFSEPVKGLALHSLPALPAAPGRSPRTPGGAQAAAAPRDYNSLQLLRRARHRPPAHTPFGSLAEAARQSEGAAGPGQPMGRLLLTRRSYF